MKIKDLIGYRLISIDNNYLIVEKDDKRYRIIIDDSYEGGCCGFNEISTTLYICDENAKRNPVITNVEYLRDSDEGINMDDRLTITFYGENNRIARLISKSGSGSGYEYGAKVKVVCDELNIHEYLTTW